MPALNPTLENSRTEKGAQRFPFLKLPGEVRNKCYEEVIRLAGSPTSLLRVFKADGKHPQARRSTAWALTQVSKQIRGELLPLVLLAQTPNVALCDLTEYLQVFHHNLSAIKTQSITNTSERNRGDDGPTQSSIVVWASPLGFHERLPSDGVDLLPVLHALDQSPDILPDFHSQCIFNWELSILDRLHHSWENWRDDIVNLGILDLHLRTKDESANFFLGRLSSSLTLRCKETMHTSEKNRVIALVKWLYKSGLRTMYTRVDQLTINFETPKTNRGQASTVKLSVYSGSIKLEWWSRGSYCKARLVEGDEGCRVDKKMVEGKDVLRL